MASVGPLPVKSDPSGALALRDLSVAFGTRIVLGPVTLDIPPHCTTVVVGDSGSGKSMLLQAINRLHEMHPDRQITGQVRLDGVDLLDKAVSAREVRRRIGMVFPTPTTLPMSVRGNFAFALGLHARVTRRERDARMVDALARSGLWPALREALDSPASSLSLGEQQHLCIARALAIGAEVLLLDDPTRMLDPAAALGLEELLDALKADVTIVLATSQLPQAARCGDQVALLQCGAIVDVGTAAEVLMPRTRHSAHMNAGP